MTDHRAYLDYNASAPLLDCAREAMCAALGLPANPSSVHAEGRAARRILEEARGRVAALVGGAAEHVVFTSGATEAANALLTPHWALGRAPLLFSHLYVCEADHPCLREGGHFAPDDVSRFKVTRQGVVDLEDLSEKLAAHDLERGLPLVAVHLVNNETGIVQPLSEISRIAKAAKAVLVIDAVQACGRIPVNLSDGYADFLIVSSHKIGGPKGAGAYIGAGGLMMPSPLLRGGGQEKGHRAGTENLAAIAGFGAAAEAKSAFKDEAGRQAALRDRLEALLLHFVPDAVIYGRNAERVTNTIYFSIPGMKAETIQIAFDLAGVAVSAGAACSSGRVGPSHVLSAMGEGDDASAVRLSIGPETGEDELGTVEKALSSLVKRRKRSTEAA